MPNFLFLYWNQLYGTENKKRNFFQELKNGMRHVKLIKFLNPVRLISGEPRLTKILPHLSYTSFRLCRIINVFNWRAGQLG